MNLARVFGDLTPRAVALLDITGSEPSELDGEPATLYTGTIDEEAVVALVGSLLPGYAGTELPADSMTVSVWVGADGLVAGQLIEIDLGELEPGTRLRQSTSFWGYGEDLDVPAPPKDDVTWLGVCGDAGVALPSV